MRRNFRVSSFIDSHFLCGIIPSAIKTKRPRSSMAEQLPLKQFVDGSSPPGVTKKGLISNIRPFCYLCSRLTQYRIIW